AALPKGTYWGPLIFIVLKNFDANAEDGRLVFRTVAPTPRPRALDLKLARGPRTVLERTGARLATRRFELEPTIHWTVDPLLRLAHHGSHVLAWDGAMILTACLLDADPPRLVHGMAEHRLMELPIIGRAARRIGAVDGRRNTCADLLRAGGAVLTFPEGVKALGRPFRERYRLLEFGHGFMHVALRTGAPIVPVAVIG